MIHVTIPNFDRFSVQQKLLVILFCLRKLENGTSLIPQSVKLPHIHYFTKHFYTLSHHEDIRPTANSPFGTKDVYGLKLRTRLRVGFSHHKVHKYKHSFQDTLNLLCPCSFVPLSLCYALAQFL